MDEQTNACELTPEQEDTAQRLRRLFGQIVADRYVDFCRLAAGAVRLRVSQPHAAHSLRELDSMLRHVLAVPLDVKAIENPEDVAKLERAREALMAVGYEQAQVHEATKKLRPVLSHKVQIQKIVERLGLDRDADVARHWISVTNAAGKAHERSLHRSLAVDEDFRAQYLRPFDTAIRAIAIKLEGHYPALMLRVEALTDMSDRAAAANAFESEIPGALPLQRHFFGRLTTGDWLPHLARKGLLDAPPAAAEEPDGTRYVQWAAGEYLLRMAAASDAATRRQVAELLRNVAASENPDVQYRGFEILGALPPEESAPLADVAIGWLGREARFAIMPGREKLVEKLAEGKQPDAALRIAAFLLQTWDQGGQIATLYGQHMYEHHLPAIASALTKGCGEDGLRLLMDLLLQAGAIRGRIEYDHHSEQPIGDDEAAKHDPFNALISAVRRSAEILVAGDPVRVRHVMAIITSHQAKVFGRLALHVLAQNPSAAPELAEKFLLDGDLIEATWCQSEYAALARAWYPSLSAQQQEAVLRVVDSMPGKYLPGWRDNFEQRHKKSPSLEDERIFGSAIVRDALWNWRSVLPRERQEALARIAEELGDPDAWRKEFFPPAEESPMDGAAFSARPIEEIVAFLKKWKPQEQNQRQTVTALAQELRTAAGNNPVAYAEHADQFIGLKPIYVRSVLNALLSEASNQGDFEWTKVLDLVAFSYCQSGHKIASAALSEGDDTDWTWACMAAGQLLAAGLRRGSEGIPFEHAPLVQSLVLKALMLAPVRSELEDFEDRFQRSPYIAAQMTLRGLGIELCILLMFWLSKDASTPAGAAPRDALQNLPHIRKALETQLDDRSRDGRVPRAIIGRYLHWLLYFGEAWLNARMPDLLPADDAELRRATWRSHLGHDEPLPSLMSELRDCYSEDIRLLRDETERDFREFHEERLVDYVMVLYLRGRLPDDLLKQFWRDARPQIRRHAVWFVAEQISRPSTEVPNDVKARGLAYWEARLAEAKQSDDPDAYRPELGAISHLCFRGQVDELWLCDQLSRMLEAGFAPTDAYNVVMWLGKVAPRHVDRAVGVLNALLRNPLIERWAYLTQREPIRAVLSEGIARGTPDTVKRVHETVGVLSTLGETSYLDFVRPAAE